MLVSNLRPECLDLFPHKWLLQAAYYCTKVVTPQENIGEIKQSSDRIKKHIKKMIYGLEGDFLHCCEESLWAGWRKVKKKKKNANKVKL